VTQLSEVTTALLAVACALFLGGVLSDLPQATLGCMVIVAVAGLIKPAELRRFWRLDRIGFWVAVGTAAAGLVLGLLAAVLIGVVLTLFLVLRELDRLGVTELHPTVAGDDLALPTSTTARLPGLLVLRFDGPLYTANVRGANRRVLAAVDAADVDTLVLDMAAVARTPLTVIDQFADFDAELAARGVRCWIGGLPPQTLATARQLPRWDSMVSDGRVFPTALAAVQAFRAERAERAERPDTGAIG
jgi:MFS superfamily sulfate permease-like transporter